MPWFAIGGIDETNVADVVDAGATRIAVVRAIGDADDPERAAAALGRRCGKPLRYHAEAVRQVPGSSIGRASGC